MRGILAEHNMFVKEYKGREAAIKKYKEEGRHDDATALSFFNEGMDRVFYQICDIYCCDICCRLSYISDMFGFGEDNNL